MDKGKTGPGRLAGKGRNDKTKSGDETPQSYLEKGTLTKKRPQHSPRTAGNIFFWKTKKENPKAVQREVSWGEQSAERACARRGL